MKQYKVTRLFTSGILEGLTHTAITAVKFDVGFATKEYIITNCEEV